MNTIIRDITNYLELFAPLSLQEDYDNAGLIVGNPETVVTGVLVSLDSTEEVVDEAIRLGCNLIVAHHPIIFKGLKKITGKNYIERTIIKAIKNDIAIYATHTNLDNVVGGVNFKIAEKLGLQNVQILSPKANQLLKLTVFVPSQNAETVAAALYGAGAGQIGNYSECSFQVAGIGTFKPNDSANPTIGSANVLEKVDEVRIEVILPFYLQNQVLTAMKVAHIYEEVAYYLSPIQNKNQEIGSGAIGNLPEPMETIQFLTFLKEVMQLGIIKHTVLLNNKIERIAVCGGAGGFLLNDAISSKADIFITSDFKYHEFFDANNRIIIADIGHYESEQFTKDLLVSYLSEKFTNFAVCLSNTQTNPVFYF